ncbi:MAG: hypothetical protein SFV21_13500 [Rhodospirillaceae bacterium]|nr:hypothetical protein [Rhodospirillaceae bacterium]
MSTTRSRPKGKRRKHHRDHAVGLYLSLVERDIRAGKRVRDLPPALAATLKRAATTAAVNLDQPIDGDVAL